MSMPSRGLGWLARWLPSLFHVGRLCPIRAFRQRRCGGPVDTALLILVALVVGLGVYRATVYYFGGQ